MYATISFRCPSCKAPVIVPNSSAGRKMYCAECGQRLLVPNPLANTVLGELENSAIPEAILVAEAVPPSPAANSVTRAEPPPLPMPARAARRVGKRQFDDDDESFAGEPAYGSRDGVQATLRVMWSIPIVRTSLILVMIGVVLLFVSAVFNVVGLVLALSFVGASLLIILLEPVRNAITALFHLGAPRWSNTVLLAGIMLVLGAGCLFISVSRLVDNRHVTQDNEAVASALGDSQAQIKAGNLDDAEKTLAEALQVKRSTILPQVVAMLEQVQILKDERDRAIAKAKMDAARAAAAKVLAAAEAALAQSDVAAAKKFLDDYLGLDHATDLARAKKLVAEISLATSKDEVLDRLAKVSDEQFRLVEKTGQLTAQFSYPGLESVFQKNVRASLVAAKQQRAEVARQREQERLAALESQKREQERQAKIAQLKAQVEAEAARKAEEEYDAGGLILLRKTVEGGYDQFSFQITGTVVNRRSRTLTYAQITFNVYDASGAQVGTALANINGLEAGGRWSFKAVAFVNNGRSYKVSKLSGF